MPRIFSEVNAVLNALGEKYINKLPKKLYNMILREKSYLYNPQYDITEDWSNQDIMKESLSMIALFHLKYWCESKEEKENLMKFFKENEKKC